MEKWDDEIFFLIFLIFVWLGVEKLRNEKSMFV